MKSKTRFFCCRPAGRTISKLAESGVENTRAQQILAIPQQLSLINQAGMCLDEQGLPVIATWWAPGTPSADYRRQYQVVFPGSGSTWETRQVSNRTIDAAGTKKDANAARDLGRPVALCDQEGRIIVLYRDNNGTNGLTIAHSLPRALDPDRLVWTELDLTTDNLGNFEPVIDLARWQRDGMLQVIYQPSAGLGYAPPANNASPLGVLEWDAAAYFQPRPQLHVAFVNAHADAALSFASQSGWDYRLWTSPDLTIWTALTTLEGTGGLLQHRQLGGGGGTKRFWRIEVKEGGFSP